MKKIRNISSMYLNSVTVHPFVSLDGSLALCHVIFKGEAITNSMITSNAVGRIGNLLFLRQKVDIKIGDRVTESIHFLTPM